MRVLSIDPGSNYGWALFENGKLVKFGDYESTPGRVEGLQAARLTLLVREEEPDVVVVEDVVRGSNTMPSWQAVWHTVGTQYVATQAAYANLALLVPVGQLSLKKYLMSGRIEPTVKTSVRKNKKTGKTTEYSRKTIEKDQVVDYINSKYGLSLRTKHHNMADAIALGEMYLESLCSTTGEVA